jgi:hypothetical protein
MKRLMTSTCLAAAFAVGLAAQSTTTATSGQNPQGQGGPRPVTASGCLRAGDTAGTYMLTDVQIQGGGRRGGDATGTTASTTGSTTAGTTAGGGTTAGASGEQGRGNMPTTLMLSPSADVDLKAHVGHKIEVTGTMAGRGAQAAGTTGGTTAGGTTTGGTSTSGTTASGTSTGTSASGGGTQGGGRGRNVTVTSVRMISESCS